MTDLEARLDRIESALAIRQLPGRYALAADSRDIEGWIALFEPDVDCGRHGRGRDVLRSLITAQLGDFYRSIHYVGSQHFDFLGTDDATGYVYCRAEHEIGDRFIVLDGPWYFARRRERHWYSADLLERPQEARFFREQMFGEPVLPGEWASWREFWAGRDTSAVTDQPAATTTSKR